LADPVDWPLPIPWETIRDAFLKHTPEGFPMQLVGEDAEAYTAAHEQCIDPRLEAMTCEAEWKNTHRLGFPKLHVTLQVGDFLVLVRRLYETYEQDNGDEGDHAYGLLNSLLYCLELELIE
jgi:hypothetical protein